MHAHEIIKDIRWAWNEIKQHQSFFIEEKDKKFLSLIKRLPAEIHDAIKWDIGDYRALKSLLPKKNLHEMAPYVRLPYKLCYFEFNLSGQKSYALLVRQPNKDTLSFYSFARWPANDPKCPKEYNWELIPVAGELCLGQTTSKTIGIRPIILHHEAAVSAFKNEANAKASLITDGWVLFDTLLLLNCKNISSQRTYLSKKRAGECRRRGLPAFSYHTLHIQVPRRAAARVTPGGPSNPVRLHLCRGHFKHYTAEAPLLGKHTGLYWWQPHVRGQNKNGIVMKDYIIETADNAHLNGG